MFIYSRIIKSIIFSIIFSTFLQAKMQMIMVCEPGEGCKPVWITIEEEEENE